MNPSYYRCCGETFWHSPAGEVHLVTTKVNVTIGEHGADLFEELGHKGVGSVEDGVHWAKGAGRLGSGVAGCQQVCLAWGGNTRWGGREDDVTNTSAWNWPLPQDWVCPGVSNSGTTRMPLRRANSITIFTSEGVYTCVYGWNAPCEHVSI